MMDIQSEKKLIQAFINGSQTAGDELVQEYYKKVLGAAIKVLNNLDDAQDIAQNVFYKVFVKRKIKKFRGDARLGSWLYRITVNECSSLMSKKYKVSESSYEHLETVSTSVADYQIMNPEISYVQNFVKKQVRRAVDELEPIYHDGLREIYYEEKSYKATSKKLNIPMHTLGVRVMRGKEKLALQLENLSRQYYGVGYNWMYNLQIA